MLFIPISTFILISNRDCMGIWAVGIVLYLFSQNFDQFDDYSYDMSYIDVMHKPPRRVTFEQGPQHLKSTDVAVYRRTG